MKSAVLKKNTIILFCAFGISLAHAETATPPPSTVRNAPAATRGNVPAVTRFGTVTTTTTTTATPHNDKNNSVVNTSAAGAATTLEQRRQQEMLNNAERIDQANRELLARNQELQLQNENLNLQNNVLKRDKSSDGVWKGALAVVVGFLMGWYFSASRRKRGSWS
jgi:hypothetical protein